MFPSSVLTSADQWPSVKTSGYKENWPPNDISCCFRPSSRTLFSDVSSGNFVLVEVPSLGPEISEWFLFRASGGDFESWILELASPRGIHGDSAMGREGVGLR